MGRLRGETLDRAEAFAHRMVDVATTLEAAGRSRRITDQIVGCGTSVAANAFEADEAVSPQDFCRCLGIVIKELRESEFWLRFVGTRRWIAPTRLEPLKSEVEQLRLVFGAMFTRTRARRKTTRSTV